MKQKGVYFPLIKKTIIYSQHGLSQSQINYQNKLHDFKIKLSLCGNYVTTNYHCKLCEEGGESESLLAFKKEIHTCGIRYCSKEDCVVQRFADTYNQLLNIKRFENLRTLHHFVIGFGKVSKFDFENNFDKIKKKHEYVLNSYFKKLRKAGVDIQAYRVLDISKGMKITFWDNKYYIHYHFVAIPFKKSETRLIISKIQAVRKVMLKKQRNKIPFHFQSFGLKKKESLLAYISLRVIGCYKQFENKEENYNINEEKSLRQSLRNNKFMLLKDLINEAQYLKYFFNHRHLNKIGDLPPFRYGSTTADNLVYIYCKSHGKMLISDRDKVRIEIIIDINPPPPPNPKEKFVKHRIQLVNAIKMKKFKLNHPR